MAIEILLGEFLMTVAEAHRVPRDGEFGSRTSLPVVENLELSPTDNIVRHSRRAEITTLHEVLWMRPRVPPTPPR